MKAFKILVIIVFQSFITNSIQAIDKEIIDYVAREISAYNKAYNREYELTKRIQKLEEDLSSTQASAAIDKKELTQAREKIKELEAKITVHDNKLKMVEKNLYETTYNKQGFK